MSVFINLPGDSDAGSSMATTAALGPYHCYTLMPAAGHTPVGRL